MLLASCSPSGLDDVCLPSTIDPMGQDPNGARIHDTRNHGCVVEMLGKKKQLGETALVLYAGFEVFSHV